jgi:GT2 family glycosyltransferase
VSVKSGRAEGRIWFAELGWGGKGETSDPKLIPIVSSTLPLMTVLVPTCGRTRELARCLAALGERETRAVTTEVVVTDDGAGDETRRMVAADFPWARWVRGPGRGPAANRNHGARQARTDWVAFVDDDCVPSGGWLCALENVASEEAVDVIEGRTDCPGQRDTAFEEHVENLTGGVLWSCNLAVRREAFERLGGFDEDFPEAGGEDMEFAWRVRQAGLRVVFAPEALVSHPPRPVTLRILWRRLWRLKWSVLFRLKTGVKRPIWADEPLNLLRQTRRMLLWRAGEPWRGPLFHLGWRWLTFPLVYPYLLIWERRFRRLLQEREHRS